MEKKKIAFTALVMACALSAGAFAVSGCKKKNSPAGTTTHVHTAEKHAKKDATCTEAGYSQDYYVCSHTDCAGKYYSDVTCKTQINLADITVGATGHDYKYTDNGNGSHKIECTVGDITVTYETHYDANGDKLCDSCKVAVPDGTPAQPEHVHSSVKHEAKGATCTEVGYTQDYYTCSAEGCEGTYYSDSACTQEIVLANITINATGHTYQYQDAGNGIHKRVCAEGDAPEIYTAHSDSDNNGKCDDCGGDASSQAPTGHAHRAVKHSAKPATCTEIGYSQDYYVCSTAGCEGKYYSDPACTQEINLADITVQPTEHHYEYVDQGDGTHKISCTTCDVNATYVVHGDKNGDKVCDDCGASLAVAPQPGPDHVHNPEKHDARSATCTEVGYSSDYYTCSTAGCEGRYYSDAECTQQIDLADITLSAKGHDYNYADAGNGKHTVSCQVGDISAITEAHVDANGDKSCDKCGASTSSGGGIGGGDIPAEMYSVTFISDGSAVGQPTTVNAGSKVTAPNLTKTGYYLTGWYTNEQCTGNAFNFNTVINANITLYAKWEVAPANITYSSAYNEGVAIEWNETNAGSAKVYYSLAGQNDYVQADKELVRQISSSTARVDVLGLKGGANYDLKVVTSAGAEMKLNNMAVTAYDRSGYAHFNYDKGVGAYNDDGTLKDNAVVIYVTDENKDTVMTEIAEKYASVTMFNIPYCADSGIASKWNGKQATGIGWWLNNSQYTASNATSSSNNVPSNTYDPVNGAKLGFRGVDAPVVVRFIGTVNTPEGCTAYDCEQEGGSNGDNGHMARMRNVKNITIEGVGEDAQIHGWGIHFMRGTDAVGDEGTSFEVRNLTFYEYAEDAVGMEGQQSGSTITASVERCWIHHNTFLPGHCANPAESDKAEGDGSCDFKRGMYFTCAYNWFEYCHKTNLIGSSNESLQYNLTYHHNTWWQCGSRIPLARQANIHFYNNYVYGDAAETSTPYSWISKPSLSHVHSLRANSYLFSEGNYYDGCKNVAQAKGGNSKGWNNIYLACDGENSIQDVTSREQSISGSDSCKYNGTNYGTFDTDPTLFYYNTATKTSDCYVTDAATARQDCLKYSGVLKHDYDEVDTSMIKDRPSKAITVPSAGLTIDLSQAKTVGAEVDGVKFVNGKYGSGQIKGKDAIAVFTLAENTEVTIQGTAILIANVNGTYIGADNFSGNLDEGTYFIRSSVKAKEGVITSISFKTGITNEQRVANVIALIDEIGTVENTAECRAKIEKAQTAYSALTSELRAQITNAGTLTEAVNTYNGLVAQPVIQAINDIGTVDANSGTKITSARSAYNKLTAQQKQLVTNIDVLIKAETDYVQYEVQGINNAISALPAVDSVTAEADVRALLAEYENVKFMYDNLTEEQMTGVTNYKKVTDGIATLNAKITALEKEAEEQKAYADIMAKLNATTDVSTLSNAECVEIVNLYEKLSESKKTEVAANATYIAVKAKHDEFAAQAKTLIFSAADNPTLVEAGVKITGGAFKDAAAYSPDGKTSYTKSYNLSDGTVSFTLSGKFKMTVYMTRDGSKGEPLAEGKRITVNGEVCASSGSKVVVENITGDVVIKKKDGCRITYIVLEPVA